jgi:hypothetical protein
VRVGEERLRHGAPRHARLPRNSSPGSFRGRTGRHAGRTHLSSVTTDQFPATSTGAPGSARDHNTPESSAINRLLPSVCVDHLGGPTQSLVGEPSPFID